MRALPFMPTALISMPQISTSLPPLAFALGLGLILGLGGCGTPKAQNPLAALCGKSYAGAVVSEQAVDAVWRAQAITLGPISCPSPDRFEMPLAVGQDQSRTWQLSLSDGGAELRHRHTLKDGSLDPVSDYGGIAKPAPVLKNGVWQAQFPADAKTIEIFLQNNLPASVSNIWTLEASKSQLVYELNRENRHFRVEIDLTRPIN